MSSTEFWEDEPQLYWAYRFSYEKKVEFEQTKEHEQLKFLSWSQGMANELAFSIALNNAFNKQKRQYPVFKDFWKESKEDSAIKKELSKRLEGVEDIDERGNIEFSYWARL